MTQDEQDYLCKYINVRFEELEKRFDIRFAEMEKRIVLMAESEARALELSSKVNDKRLDGMNEWRSTVEDILATTVRQSEFALHIENQRREIDAFSKFKEERVSVPTDIINLQKDVKILNSFRDNMDGKASQSSVMITLGFAIVSFIFGAVNLVIHLSGN